VYEFSAPAMSSLDANVESHVAIAVVSEPYRSAYARIGGGVDVAGPAEIQAEAVEHAFLGLESPVWTGDEGIAAPELEILEAEEDLR
jgi:hypothetical protein